MPTFIVRIELHPADPDQAHSDVHAAMEQAGFSRMYRHNDGLRYHLPSGEYCLTSTGSAETVRDLAKATVSPVTTLFMVVASETTRIALAGLVPVTELVPAVPGPAESLRPTPAIKAA